MRTPFLEVSPGARSHACPRGCGLVVYPAIHAGRSVLVNCDVTGGWPPSAPGEKASEAGRGLVHQVTCADAQPARLVAGAR